MSEKLICAEVLADQLRFMNPDPSHEYVPSLAALGRNPWFLALSHFGQRFCTEALKGHRVVWKIEICYLIRMTYEWKPMSSGWHNNIVVTHPDEIPISAKSPGWHTVYDMSSGWHTAVSKSHPDEIRPGANSSGWLRVQMTLCHPDDIGEYRKSSGWHPTMLISHPDVIPPIVKSSGWDTANS